MARQRQELCDHCHRYTHPSGALCDHCSKEANKLQEWYQKLLERYPQWKRLTPSQVYLQLIRAYMGS